MLFPVKPYEPEYHMKVRYCIFAGKDYLSSVQARISGKNGARTIMGFTEKVTDGRSPPIVYDKLTGAQGLLTYLQTHMSEDFTKGFEIVSVTVSGKNKVTVKGLKSGLSVEETGTLT